MPSLSDPITINGMKLFEMWRCRMHQDTSHWFYGKMYGWFADPFMRWAREDVAKLIVEQSTVLDAACGTGKLARTLRENKNCQVVGVDLSLRMIEYAETHNSYPGVSFLHRDAANIHDFAENSFDYTTIAMALHELPQEKQVAIVAELARLGRQTIILDLKVPMPRTPLGIGVRIAECFIGSCHDFREYSKSGGILGILQIAGLGSRVAHTSTIKGGFGQVVLLAA